MIDDRKWIDRNSGKENCNWRFAATTIIDDINLSLYAASIFSFAEWSNSTLDPRPRSRPNPLPLPSLLLPPFTFNPRPINASISIVTFSRWKIGGGQVDPVNRVTEQGASERKLSYGFAVYMVYTVRFVHWTTIGSLVSKRAFWLPTIHPRNHQQILRGCHPNAGQTTTNTCIYI